MDTITVDAIANVHCHLRNMDNRLMESLISYSILGGADVLGLMPNPEPNLTTAERVLIYERFAASCIPNHSGMIFIPFLMITEHTTIKDIDECIKAEIKNAKVYPLNRTTNSENGVRDYHKILDIVRYCGEVGIMVHFHPEEPNLTICGDDAEYQFVTVLDMFIRNTDTVIVSEHGTDHRCIPFWEEWAKTGRFYVTLTAHHLAGNKDIHFGDVRAICKPPIKNELDRLGLVALVEKDYSWVMAGADDAPHPKSSKHPDKGRCACGAYTSPFLAPLYAHALDNLLTTNGPNGRCVFENFISVNARRLHDLGGATKTIELKREPMKIPLVYKTGHAGWEEIQPFMAGEEIKWSLV